MNKDTSDQIERYLQKRLEGIELRKFEDQLGKDESLRKRVKLERELTEAISDNSDFNIFRRIIRETSDDYFNGKPATGFSPVRIAASLALLIAGSWLIWTYSRPTTPDELYSEFFEPYVIQTTPRSLTEGTSAYMMGTSHYKEEKYDLAIIELEAHLQEAPNDYRAQLMLAISHFALRNFDDAEPILLQMVNDPDHLFQDQVRWYLGLLYVTDRDKENDWKAEKYFEGIEDERFRDKIKSLD